MLSSSKDNTQPMQFLPDVPVRVQQDVSLVTSTLKTETREAWKEVEVIKRVQQEKRKQTLEQILKTKNNR